MKLSTSYLMLFIFVIPYGLGAGAIDAPVNHYVANNYSGSGQYIGIGIMPFYLLIFAVLNISMLERTYVVLKSRKA